MEGGHLREGSSGCHSLDSYSSLGHCLVLLHLLQLLVGRPQLQVARLHKVYVGIAGIKLSAFRVLHLQRQNT